MSFQDNLKRVRDSIETVCARTGSRHEIVLVAVTKTFPAEILREAVNNGISDIGENRVQEAEKKFAEISGLSFTRHLIGHLQSNKANKAAALFDWVQSLDSPDTAVRLDRKLAELNRTMNVLIEINTSGEPGKNGIPPGEASELTGRIGELPRLKLSGLMTIGPFDRPPEAARVCFRELRRIREKLSREFPSLDLRHLSMGMSDDYGIAIEEGSTMIRLGRALFGGRA